MLDKQLKEKANILSRIVAFIIFVIVVIYYGITITTSNTMNKQMDVVGEHPFAVTVKIGDVKADLTLLRTLPERLTYSQEESVREGIQTHYDKIEVSMNNSINLLHDRYLADNENVPQFEKVFQDLVAAQKELLIHASEPTNTAQDLQEFVETNILPKLDELDDVANIITNGAGRKFNEYSALVTSSHTMVTTMASILSVTVLAAIAFYLYLIKLKQEAEKDILTVRTELEVEQRANAAKSQFLFNMSHDIRTPMNAIIGLTAIAAINVDKPEKTKECLTKISSSSRHLLGLINDVLDMSRIESGKVSLNEEDFLLPAVIDDFISITRSQAIEKGLVLEVNIHNLIHERVIADPIRIKRILSNLVGNSIKFTSEGGHVHVTFAELPPTVKGYGNYKIIVSDTGVGMSNEFIKKIFQPFERAANSTKSRVEGTGLGMAITKNIIDMMGGSIKVESVENQGTTFTIILPIKLQDGEEEEIDFSSLRDLRSLIVDDDVISCENTASMIQEIGMKSEWVSNGLEAIKKVQDAHDMHQNYHVIIIDWQMPELDGLETTQKIREIIGGELPIIFLTAYDWIDVEEEARKVGVSAFLTKPVFKSRLYHVMQHLTTNTQEIVKENFSDINIEKHCYDGHVLLVEDNEINMEIAEEFLFNFGIYVDKAWDGQEAVEIVKAALPGYYDLIFMDIQMPKLDGYKTTETIRCHEEAMSVHTPIVAMSANAFNEEIEKGYASGMDGYITKPVDIQKLDNVLELYLKKSHA